MLVEELKEARQQIMNNFMPHVRTELGVIADRYDISVLFVGLFGSQAKGYAGPESDYDFYVVYHGKLGQYVKAIDFDTRQFKEEEVLPPQISIDVPYLVLDNPPAQNSPELISSRVEKARVQLNFVSYDAFMRELGDSNLDFRIALDNICISADDKSIEKLAKNFATVSYDPQKYKHTGYSRALKAEVIIKKWKSAENTEAVRRSEVTDCLYRLFMGWAATSVRMIPWLALNRTVTLTQLIDQYLEIMGDDPEIRELREIVPLIASGSWPQAFEEYADNIVNVINRLVPFIKPRPVAIAPTYLVDRSQAAKLTLINKVNETFVGLLLKGGK